MDVIKLLVAIWDTRTQFDIEDELATTMLNKTIQFAKDNYQLCT